MRIVNVRCGSDIRDKLRAGGVPGDFVEFSDPVCQGPVPEVSESDFEIIRAAFIVSAYGDADIQQALGRLRRERADLEATLDYDRIVLWFEHDIYDQSILVRVLDFYAHRLGTPAKLHLVGIDRFPGVERFIGLGQLTAAQLATLIPHAQPVTATQIAAASSAWAAYRRPDPTGSMALVRDGMLALPFLAAALRRLLQELPWRTDGLGLSERLALEAIRAGADTPARAFAAAQIADPQPYLGDIMFAWILQGLAKAPTPAITPFATWTDRLALTPTGSALLDRRADWTALNGIDRWVAGTHLSAGTGVWRWDATRNDVARGD